MNKIFSGNTIKLILFLSCVLPIVTRAQSDKNFMDAHLTGDLMINAALMFLRQVKRRIQFHFKGYVLG